MAPAVWCSVSRYVVNTYGNTSLLLGLIGLLGSSSRRRAGLFCWP
jgi:hypothetical protein